MSDLKLLDGVKVVDMSAFVAAPMAAEILPNTVRTSFASSR